MKDNLMSVMCPLCGKFLSKAKRNDKTIHQIACKKCHKWIWYIPSDDEYRFVKDIPERATSSGKRFY